MTRENTILIANGHIQIAWDYKWTEDDVILKDQISSMDGKWDGEYWNVPSSPWHAQQLLDLNTDVEFYIGDGVKKLAKENKVLSKAATKIKARKIDGLYPFQAAGVEFIEKTQGRALVADDMGLGKTVEALTWAQRTDYRAERILVVAPANVIYKWQDEVYKWMEHTRSQVVIGNKEIRWDDNVHIMSYAIMTRRKKELVGYDLIIWDECHYLKNYKAQRTKAAQRICMGVPHILGLSGTPFTNRPIEMFTILNMINPAMWPDVYKYGMRYCNGNKDTGYLDFSGSSNEEELADRLKPIMIRRMKADVLDQLPAMRRSIIPVDIVGRKEYNAALKEAKALIQTAPHPLAKLTRLRKAVGMGKTPAAIKWATNFLESTDEKLVIYAHHKSVIDALESKLYEYGVTKIVGDVSSKQRAIRAKKFQEEAHPRVMIISSAGGEGIDLYAASNILFVERQWTPAQEEQAEARLHRIGQENAVTAWYLAARNTVDERLAYIVEGKREVFKKIVGGADVLATITKELMEELT